MNYKEYLENDVLKFWLDNALDKEYGGIFTCVDRSGELYSDEKSVWFQGRALWVFSKAYNFIEKKKEWLDAAKLIYDFLPECTDVDGRMFFIVTRDGKEVQKRRYFFSETFAAIGCAEYYKATGDRSVFESAQKYFDTAYNVFKNPELSTPKFNGENRPLKALSPVMIMLATAHVMESAGINSEKYKKIAMEMADEILCGGFLNDEAGALLESVTTDGKFSDTATGRIVNPGHSLEAAWFLMSEAVLHKNDAAMQAAKKIIDITMPIGWDEKYGGIIAFTDVKDKPRTQLEWDMKLWWPQCEAIIANGLAYKFFGESKYLDNYNKLMDYAFKYMVDKECGEWYGYLHYDNRLIMLLCAMEQEDGFEKYLA